MNISIGRSRKDRNWKAKDIPWDEIVHRLSVVQRTRETMNEYKKMTKAEKAAVKDVGGFVGGTVKGGRRIRGSVESRSLITLDADYAELNFWENATALNDFAMCCYSTHSHQSKAPRLRLVIPLARDVTSEEYEPLARKIAAVIGIDQFDVTTYEPTRLMYWPSASIDGEFFFEQQNGDFLNPDEVLARYEDWRDVVSWPLGTREQEVRLKDIRVQGDPLTKPGLVGAFNRVYTISEAIEKFIPDEYIACEGGRYTFTGGTTYGGAVVYGNDAFLYSHHETDPAGGILCNAFDLVRLHKYKELDGNSEAGTSVNKLPSYSAMCKLASEDSSIKELLIDERKNEAVLDFGEPITDEENWIDKLRVDAKTGRPISDLPNVTLILANDENLKGKIAFNDFLARKVVTGEMPWRKVEEGTSADGWTDSDDSCLRLYLKEKYDISGRADIDDAVQIVSARNRFHPVRDYLESLSWDGKKRVETLFIEYLRAEDNEYTREATRVWMTAAVARILAPGCKFDNMLVLVGEQGIGKSHFYEVLAGKWFSNSFTTVQGKEAMEQIQGVWIMEIGELSGFKKAESEAIKAFVSKREDSFRGAYKRNQETYKRQCVFVGTTNDYGFLRDTTGNRRFWPITCRQVSGNADVRMFGQAVDGNPREALTEQEINQIWAEAVYYFRRGDKLKLSEKAEKMARVEQARYREDDPREGVIQHYLNMKLPRDWEKLTRSQRRDFVMGYTADSYKPDELTFERAEVCISELAYELYGIDNLSAFEAKAYHSLMRTVKGWNRSDARKITNWGKQWVYIKEE